MSKLPGAQIDASDFTKGMKQYTKLVSKESIAGMRNVIDQLLNDCISVEPTVPLKEGNLRGDVLRSVEVVDRSVKGTLLFKMPYAQDQHENLDYKHTEPGSGAKYLESKLARFKKRYFGMMARAIRSVS